MSEKLRHFLTSYLAKDTNSILNGLAKLSILTAFRKKSPILKECEGANSTNEWVGDEFRLALANVIFLSLFAIIRE